ncbi:efflux transporter outer membrane subunit [Luteibacter aegosomaticola]|uniref:efflux transporter outer membrane subunit n=1 Tax=Luteibacter aegosomaticola TaxID=2911538 RepID=UPI001FF9B037|nr:efflux transporter outer membrane subunit [Luteibacter aegosomaticola]UPG90249.1 efflux transporter outer membrane subunit [Luteibacter aegosomaticola]
MINVRSNHARRTALAAVLGGATLALLSGCMVGPDYQRPADTRSTHFDAQAEQKLEHVPNDGAPSVAYDAHIDTDWWTLFHSPRLDGVVKLAIEGNRDLDAANATIAQANEAIAAAGGALQPQVAFGAQAGRQRTGFGTGRSTSNVYAVGPSVSFDLDLFGGTRRRIEEATALADLERHRFDAAYLTVTGEVATQAIQFASARAQIAAVNDLIATDRHNLALVSSAKQYGSATSADIALAQSQLAQDETLLPPLEQQRDVARHALSVLAGKGPADWVPPDFGLADFTLPAALPLSLPSELARQRPDILAAEAQLHAASAAVGVATADRYPHLQLSGALTQASAGAGVGTLWNLFGGLAGPLFDGGTLKANQRGAADAYDASMARYQQTVVIALGQVADVLQAISHDADGYAAQGRALDAAETSLRLSQQGFAAGDASVLAVLDAQRARQRALVGQIQARTAQYLDAVQLAVALGGQSGEAFLRKAPHEPSLLTQGNTSRSP